MSAFDLCRVAGTVFLAVTLVVIGDTCGKLLTQAGVAPFVVAWSRFAIGALVIVPLARIKMQDCIALKDWRVLLRGVFITGGICSILTALKSEPIANVFGAFFIGPIISYILAVVFLKERPTTRHTLLLCLGFLGVLLVVKPGFGMSAGTLFALLAGICYGCYLFMTKLLAGTMHTRVLLVSQLSIGTLLLTPIGINSPMPANETVLWLLIAASALASAGGNYLLVIANRMADASLVAPLIYTQLISATLLGILVFGDWPDPIALSGLALIALSGFGSLVLKRS